MIVSPVVFLVQTSLNAGPGNIHGKIHRPGHRNQLRMNRCPYVTMSPPGCAPKAKLTMLGRIILNIHLNSGTERIGPPQ